MGVRRYGGGRDQGFFSTFFSFRYFSSFLKMESLALLFSSTLRDLNLGSRAVNFLKGNFTSC